MFMLFDSSSRMNLHKKQSLARIVLPLPVLQFSVNVNTLKRPDGKISEHIPNIRFNPMCLKRSVFSPIPTLGKMKGRAEACVAVGISSLFPRNLERHCYGASSLHLSSDFTCG